MPGAPSNRRPSRKRHVCVPVGLGAVPLNVRPGGFEWLFSVSLWASVSGCHGRPVRPDPPRPSVWGLF
jgi:hypothetical protein